MKDNYRVALIPGDGIGREVLSEGVKVMEAAARRFDFEFSWSEFDWSCERFHSVGEIMPACLLYTSPSPRDRSLSRMPSSA